MTLLLFILPGQFESIIYFMQTTCSFVIKSNRLRKPLVNQRWWDDNFQNFTYMTHPRICEFNQTLGCNKGQKHIESRTMENYQIGHWSQASLIWNQAQSTKSLFSISKTSCCLPDGRSQFAHFLILFKFGNILKLFDS